MYYRSDNYEVKTTSKSSFHQVHMVLMEEHRDLERFGFTEWIVALELALQQFF